MMALKALKIISGDTSHVQEIVVAAAIVAVMINDSQEIRKQIIRELDEKYNKICETKINAALEFLEKRVKELEQINTYNADSIRRGLSRNHKLQAVAEAAAYCYRNGHIEEAAVIFSGLDKALEALEDRNGTGKDH